MQSFREDITTLLLLLKQIFIFLAKSMAIFLLLYLARRHEPRVCSKNY